MSLYKTCTKLTDETFLVFWKRHETKLPLLSKAAQKVLSLPESTSESERHWSQLRLTVPHYRSLLKGQTINALLNYNNALHYEQISLDLILFSVCVKRDEGIFDGSRGSIY